MWYIGLIDFMKVSLGLPHKKNIFAMLELGLPIFPVKVEYGLPFLSMWYKGLIDFIKVSLCHCHNIAKKARNGN